MSIILTEYTAEDANDVLALLCRGATPGYREWKERIWNWQYAENPFVSNGTAPLVLKKDDRIIGFYGAMPVLLKYKEERIAGVWGCDFFVDPEFRKMGFGTRMAREMHERNRIFLGLGTSDAAASILARHGREMSHEVDEFFRRKKIASVREFAKKGIQRVHAVRNRTRPSTLHLKTRIVDASNIPDEVEALWNAVEDGYSKTVIRNYAYLKWKYGSHPLVEYDAILVSGDEQLVGVGIFRRHGKTSRLVDYVGPAEGMDIKASIVDTFMEACWNAESLNCICSDNEFKERLEAAGFRRFHGKPSFGVFSSLPEDQGPEHGWFVMAGDSDEDLVADARDFLVEGDTSAGER